MLIVKLTIRCTLVHCSAHYFLADQLRRKMVLEVCESRALSYSFDVLLKP